MATVGYYHPAPGEQQITPDQEINWQRLVTPEVRQRFSEDDVTLIKAGPTSGTAGAGRDGLPVSDADTRNHGTVLSRQARGVSRVSP